MKSRPWEGFDRTFVSELRADDRFVVAVDAKGAPRWVSELLLLDVTSVERLEPATVERVEQVSEGEWPERFCVTFRFAGEGLAIGGPEGVNGLLGVHRLPAHFTACGECGELWPCRDARLGWQAERMTQALDGQCAHCGKPIGGAWDVRVSDGLTTRRFHEAKKYRANGKLCREAAAEAQREIAGATP